MAIPHHEPHTNHKAHKAHQENLNHPGPPAADAHGVGYAFAASIDRAVSRPPAVSRWIVTGGRRVALSAGDNVIGRDPAATIFLDVAGVSRHHAHIMVGERDAVLEDLGSKNGTRVRGKPVTGKVVLRDGDQIHVGPVVVIYHASASGISTETIVGPFHVSRLLRFARNDSRRVCHCEGPDCFSVIATGLTRLCHCEEPVGRRSNLLDSERTSIALDHGPYLRLKLRSVIVCRYG